MDDEELEVSDEDLEQLYDDKGYKTLKMIKKEISKQRSKINVASLFFMATGIFLLRVFIYHDNLVVMNINAISSFTALAIAIAIYARIINKEKEYLKNKDYDEAALKYLHKLSDKYIKKTFNTLGFIFIVLFALFINNMSMILGGTIKLREIWMVTASVVVISEIPVYFHIENILCSRLIQSRINIPDHKKVVKHIKYYWALSGFYWVGGMVSIALFKKKVDHITGVYIELALVYILLVFIYNVTLRKKLTYKNIVINYPKIALYMSLAILTAFAQYMQRDTWYTLPYISTTPRVEHPLDKIEYDDATGVYTITAKNDEFKILQLTDIHLGGSLYSYKEDMLALKTVYAEINYTKPDLVVVTGDLTFPVGVMSMSFNNTAPVSQFAQFMRNMGIPWVFTYGNHDTESLATGSTSDLDSLYRSLSFKTSGTLLYPYSQQKLTGRSNQLIELRNADGSLNQAIFLIDSNAYTGDGLNEYDYIHDDQVAWYEENIKRLEEEEKKNISSLVFFHIPLQEYKTAYELYCSSSSEVKYYFGENNEKVKGKVSCSDYPSGLFDKMVELGSTKAAFCGHDHYNNMSLEYKGIRLTYGMSIDYLAMPGIEYDTAQRGGTLITIHKDSSYDIEQVPYEKIK